MNINKYKDLVSYLVTVEKVDFSRDVMLLTHTELTKYHNLAKVYGYKKPVMHSRGFGFYMLLQRIYNKMSK